jgi:hypothetical protein
MRKWKPKSDHKVEFRKGCIIVCRKETEVGGGECKKNWENKTKFYPSYDGQIY